MVISLTSRATEIMYMVFKLSVTLMFEIANCGLQQWKYVAENELKDNMAWYRELNSN